LCLACEPCNTKKGTQDIKIFLAKKPDVLKKILVQAKRPLKDASAVNSTRWALFNRLKETGKVIATGSGGLTKFNRIRIVKAVVTSGKKIGTYTGRVAVRSSGSFNMSSGQGLIQGINHKYCCSVHQKDGTMDFKSIDGTLFVSHVPFSPRAKATLVSNLP
jgi:hypothetical protein